MYPSVSFTSTPSYSSTDYSWVPLPSGVAAAKSTNGELSSELASSTAPTLRVVLSEPFRTAPPIRVSLKLQELVAGTQGSGGGAPITRNLSGRGSFDFETQTIERAKQMRGHPVAMAGPDPFEGQLARYTGLGLASEDVAIGRAAAGGDAASEESVAAACHAVAELKSMGFPMAHILGALSLAKGDVGAATEACLAAAS